MEDTRPNPAAADQPVTVEGRPSAVGRVAIAASVISFLGLLILLIGDIANIEGAKEDEEGPVIFDIAWISFSVGALIALVAGLIAFVQGRSRGDAGTKRAGQLALIYFVVAVLLLIVIG